MRSFSGDYPLAFMTSGLACLSASLLALRIKRLAPAIVPATKIRLRFTVYRRSGVRPASAASGYLDALMAIYTKNGLEEFS